MIELTDSDVRAWAADAAGDPDVDVTGWRLQRVDYGSPSPTTGGLWRVVGPAWSLFVKVVQDYRHWELLHMLPPAIRAEALATTSWRHEADLYESCLGSILPPGMRLPAVYDVRDDGDGRVLVVMEDVVASDLRWDTDRYARAARSLGRLDVRMTQAPELPRTELHERGAMLRRYVESRVRPHFISTLLDDATWRHPLLRPAGLDGLRADLVRLAARVPSLLDSLGAHQHVRTHGDATPHNLLVPRDRPEELVVIDWAMGTTAPAGEELGQLLIGGAHEGDLDDGDLVTLREVVVPAYVAGLADEGLDVAAEAVRTAMDTTITLRSAFTALPLERFDEPVTDELAALVARRIRLTRHLVDVGLTLDAVDAAA